MPLVPTPDRQKREARGLWFAFGRMADGVTFESARSELETIGSRLDPTALITAAVVLALAALVGCLIPARRAMRVDPVVALRHE